MRANHIEIQTAAQPSIHEPMNNDEEKAVDFCELGQSDFVVALRCADIVVSFFSMLFFFFCCCCCCCRCNCSTPQFTASLIRCNVFTSLSACATFSVDCAMHDDRIAKLVANRRTNELEWQTKQVYDQFNFISFCFCFEREKKHTSTQISGTYIVASSTKFAPSFRSLSVFSITSNQSYIHTHTSISISFCFFSLFSFPMFFMALKKRCACVLFFQLGFSLKKH